MGYFNNPKTEEELKNQFRQILRKIGYTTGKNNDEVKRVYEEYQEWEMKIKRANGYRTGKEIVADLVDEAKELSEEAKKARLNEEKRISQLKNKNYSSEEIKSLVAEVKKYIKKIVTYRDTNYNHYSKIHKQAQYGAEYVCRWFNTHIHTLSNYGIEQQYNAVRERLEYALKSQARTKGDEESYMTQMEVMLGKYILTIFETDLAEQIDPITYVEYNTKMEQQEEDDKKGLKTTGNFFLFGAVLSFAMELFYPCGIGLLFALIFGAAYFIWFILTKGAIRLATTYSGTGLQKKKSRVTEKEVYYKERFSTSIGKIIIGIIGFLLISSLFS